MSVTGDFDDLLANNESYQQHFALAGAPGAAQAGVAVVTCMDARIEPLAMLGLHGGDAKVIRTPGGRLTPDAFVGCVLGAHLLGVDRILVVAHTKCAMASGEDDDIRTRVREADGCDLTDLRIGASKDQEARLREDVDQLRSSPYVPESVAIGGFVYDVDNGKLTQLV